MTYLKISSSEITNAPLALEFAKKRKVIIESMDLLKDIENALCVLACGFMNINPSKKSFSTALNNKKGKAYLNKYVTLLHCTSSYPTEYKNINLKTILSLKNKFKVNIGFSDHSEGVLAPIVATALGATIIEKHITIDKKMEGPDHKASVEPKEFEEMVRYVRSTMLVLGDGLKKITKEEIKNQKVARKSLHASKNIYKGEVFNIKNIIFIPSHIKWNNHMNTGAY